MTPNVVLSAAYLMPVRGMAITAHSTRARVLGLIDETRAKQGSGERAMIVDVSATTWNWDTYAIVGGKPSHVSVCSLSYQKDRGSEADAFRHRTLRTWLPSLWSE